jgi:hypothetical protein
MFAAPTTGTLSETDWEILNGSAELGRALLGSLKNLAQEVQVVVASQRVLEGHNDHSKASQ